MDKPLIIRNLTDEEVENLKKAFETGGQWRHPVILAEAHELEIIDPHQLDSEAYNDYRWMPGPLK